MFDIKGSSTFSLLFALQKGCVCKRLSETSLDFFWNRWRNGETNYIKRMTSQCSKGFSWWLTCSNMNAFDFKETCDVAWWHAVKPFNRDSIWGRPHGTKSKVYDAFSQIVLEATKEKQRENRAIRLEGCCGCWIAAATRQLMQDWRWSGRRIKLELGPSAMFSGWLSNFNELKLEGFC